MSGTLIISILLLVSVVINVLLFTRRGAGKFNRELNTFFSQNMVGRISLASLFSPTSSSNKEITSHLNSFIEKLRTTFKNVFSLGFSLTKTSDEMKDSSKQLLAMSDETSFQASQVATAMEEMSATVSEIARNASTAAESSAATRQNAESAESDITENMKSIEHLSQNVSSWADTNRALSEATAKIDEIILTINDIADQTNLLALNAAIEAARAGEHGRGFAIVADEVRKLADKTGQATEEIGGMIKNVKTEAENSLDTMDSTLKGVDESIDRSRHAEESLNKIVSEVKHITDMIQQIAVAAEEQSKVSDDVLSNMEKVSGNAAETKNLAANISESGDALAMVSLKLYNQLCSIKIDSTDNHMENLLLSCSSDFSAMLSDSVKQSRIDKQSLFDENYVQTGEEGKFSVKSNRLFDSVILPMLQKWSQSDNRLIYAVAMDRNGYMPTHTLPDRARVKMNDPISLNGAKSSTIVGQAFRRPIAAGGELVVDIACPITIEGRHWGCLRIGYLPEMQ